MHRPGAPLYLAMNIATALTEIEAVVHGARLEPATAAKRLAHLVLPPLDNAGADYYRSRASDWLTLLLRARPGITLPELVDQLQRLADIAPEIRTEVCPVACRLSLALRYRQAEASDAATAGATTN